MNHTCILTSDGSHTLYVESLDEHYHSTHGAIQEALHVYIHAGLAHANTSNAKILEIGFGTGLNALLTCIFAIENKCKILYQSIEKYPLHHSLLQQLNYNSLVGEQYHSLFSEIHNAPWETTTIICPNFSIVKHQADVLFHPPVESSDVIYFDAFAPNKQPELWNKSTFSYLFTNLNKNGILTTYCAKGIVRRTMIEAGFSVERIAGPPGKREMLRATKKQSVFSV